ncbi:hypothetical protein [Thermoflexus sp.]|uniref:hypothetical protein n=1 Tax=Thermoflexus sp. TaxID=1969742 RepID=UPI0025D01D8C|nr:hypothetical protein [Thermoflexus sp.]MDW8180986.1 hypothetical protein [Anaerolineae bacterium]MCS6965060.1 hypothetical protein [Thermoflexus sp.]MCS7351528.1 hypothetical protein [Thermoflexus sp.]MCX7690846.1 hypothetical protein [Thermoflexus sp.]MDW8185301.1 hypothetical protein [Anaerolineae bacterium]
MSAAAIDELVGWALIDERIREDLLGSRRAEVLARYDLTEEERTWLLQVRAKDLTDFAAAAARWIEHRSPRDNHPYPYFPFA